MLYMAKTVRLSQLRSLIALRTSLSGQLKGPTPNQQNLLPQQLTRNSTPHGFHSLQLLHAEAAETAALHLSSQFDERNDTVRESSDGGETQELPSSSSESIVSDQPTGRTPSAEARSVDSNAELASSSKPKTGSSTLSKEIRRELGLQFITRYKQDNGGKLPSVARVVKEVGGGRATWQKILNQQATESSSITRPPILEAEAKSIAESPVLHADESSDQPQLESLIEDPGRATLEGGEKEEGLERTEAKSVSEQEGLELTSASSFEDPEVAALDYPPGKSPPSAIGFATSTRKDESDAEDIAEGKTRTDWYATQGGDVTKRPHPSEFVDIGVSEMPLIGAKANEVGGQQREKYESGRLEEAGSTSTLDISRLYGVYVENLWPRLINEELARLFHDCGEVAASKVCHSKAFPGRVFGFVYFKTAEGAQAAIEKVQKVKLFNDRRLYAEPAKGPLKHLRGTFLAPGNTVMFKGIRDRLDSHDHMPPGNSDSQSGKLQHQTGSASSPENTGSWQDMLDGKGVLAYGVCLMKVPDSCAEEALEELRKCGEVVHSRLERRNGWDFLYVDFKTDEARNRALALGQVWVGHGAIPLAVMASREIVPTTVRLSRVPPTTRSQELQNKCNAVAPVELVHRRAPTVADVDFKLASMAETVAQLNSSKSAWTARVTPQIPKEYLGGRALPSVMQRFIEKAIESKLPDLEASIELMQTDLADIKVLLTALVQSKEGGS